MTFEATSGALILPDLAKYLSVQLKDVDVDVGVDVDTETALSSGTSSSIYCHSNSREPRGTLIAGRDTDMPIAATTWSALQG